MKLTWLSNTFNILLSYRIAEMLQILCLIVIDGMSLTNTLRIPTPLPFRFTLQMAKVEIFNGTQSQIVSDNLCRYVL